MSRGRRKVVCSFCRKRKIKCDMQSPCQACVRFGNPDCDITLVPGWKPAMAAVNGNRVLKPLGESSDVEVLKQRLSYLESLLPGLSDKPPRALSAASKPELDDEFSFYDGIKPVEYLDTNALRRLGLLRWLVPVSLDEGLFRLCQYVLPRKKLAAAQETPIRPELLITILLCSDPYDGASAVPEFQRRSTNLEEEVQHILPTKRVLWQLVDRFFNVLYQFVPVLDEQDFREAISALVGKKALTDERPVVTPTKEAVFAHLGILLVVLRLSYLSLFNSMGAVRRFCFYNSQLELEFLAHAEILPLAVNVAEECVKEYDLVRDVRLEVVQLIALIRSYMMNNPGNANPDIQNLTYLAILNLLAYNRWLHRDPRAVFNAETLGYRKATMLRKLWYTIVHLDFSTLVFSGNIPTIAPVSYDVELPEFRSNGLNILDTKLDATVCNEIVKFADLRALLAEALELLGNVQGHVMLHEVEAMAEKLEAKELELYEQVMLFSTSYTHNVADAFLRVSDFHSYLMVYFMYSGFCIHLYYYHVRQHLRDKAFQYRVKMMSVLLRHFFPFMLLVLDDEKNPFGGSTDLFTMAIASHCVIQTVTFIWTTYVDFRTQMHYIQIRPGLLSHPVLGAEYQNLLPSLSVATGLLLQIVNVMCRELRPIMHRHQLYSRIIHVNDMILKLATTHSYYEQHSVLSIELVTTAQVNEILEYINDCLGHETLQSLSPESNQLMTPSPSSTSSAALANSFTQFEPTFDLLLFEDLFEV